MKRTNRIAQNVVERAKEVAPSKWNDTQGTYQTNFNGFRICFREDQDEVYYSMISTFYLDVYEGKRKLISTPEEKSGEVRDLYLSVVKANRQSEQRAKAREQSASLSRLEKAL